MLVSSIGILAGSIVYVRVLLWCSRLRTLGRLTIGTIAWLAFCALILLPLFSAMRPALRPSLSSYALLAWLLICWVGALAPGFIHIRRRLPELRAAGFFAVRKD